MDSSILKVERREMRKESYFLKTDVPFLKEQSICSKKYVFPVSSLLLLRSILFCYHRMQDCATGSIRLFFKEDKKIILYHQ